MNKKIRNASCVDYDGISFKSKQELSIYKLFKDNGLNLEYEPKKAIILEGFDIDYDLFDCKGQKNKKELINKRGTKVKPITYTPDFIYRDNDCVYIIEVKGFSNDVFPIKKKMFEFLLSKNKRQNFVFAILYNQANARQLINIIKNKNNGNKQIPQSE